MSLTSDTEEEIGNISDQTYVTKPVSTSSTRLPKNNHPPYIAMVQEAVSKLAVGRAAVSRIKIGDYCKETYGLNDISKTHLSKALKTAQEKCIIENKTSTGATGSFKLTKLFKEKQKAAAKALTKKESSSKLKKDNTTRDDDDGAEIAEAASTTKATRKPSKTKKTSEVEEDESDKKKVKKKPPTAAGKGKENQDAAAKPTKSTAKESSGEKKILKEKINSMKKASSTGALKKTTKEALPLSDGDEEEPIPAEIVEAPKKRGRRPAAK